MAFGPPLRPNRGLEKAASPTFGVSRQTGGLSRQRLAGALLGRQTIGPDFTELVLQSNRKRLGHELSHPDRTRWLVWSLLPDDATLPMETLAAEIVAASPASRGRWQ